MKKNILVALLLSGSLAFAGTQTNVEVVGSAKAATAKCGDGKTAKTATAKCGDGKTTKTAKCGDGKTAKQATAKCGDGK